jgi:hypothetical protein
VLPVVRRISSPSPPSWRGPVLEHLLLVLALMACVAAVVVVVVSFYE